MSTIDLYCYLSSPYCRSVMIAADTIGISLNLLKRDKANPDLLAAELASINPEKTVPTIQDKEFVLWESRAILIYLAEKYDKTNTLYPKDVEKRAIIQQKLFFDLELWNKIFDFYRLQKLDVDAPPNQEKLDKILEALRILDVGLVGKTFLLGEEVTVADIAIVTTVSTLEAIKFDLSSFKNLTNFLEKCKKALSGYNGVAVQSLEAFVANAEKAKMKK